MWFHSLVGIVHISFKDPKRVWILLQTSSHNTWDGSDGYRRRRHTRRYFVNVSLLFLSCLNFASHYSQLAHGGKLFGQAYVQFTLRGHFISPQQMPTHSPADILLQFSTGEYTSHFRDGICHSLRSAQIVLMHNHHSVAVEMECLSFLRR